MNLNYTLDKENTKLRYVITVFLYTLVITNKRKHNVVNKNPTLKITFKTNKLLDHVPYYVYILCMYYLVLKLPQHVVDGQPLVNSLLSPCDDLHVAFWEEEPVLCSQLIPETGEDGVSFFPIQQSHARSGQDVKWGLSHLLQRDASASWLSPSPH